MERGARFRYEQWAFDPGSGVLTCAYSLDEHRFTERITFQEGADLGPAGAAAARLVFLLAGISYYKTLAPPVIDLGDTALTSTEAAFLRSFYLDGLAEFSVTTGVALDDLTFAYAERTADPVPVPTGGGPLVPFGGGIDSTVVVELTRRTHPDLALFINSRGGRRFAAIEEGAAITGLPVLRTEQELDPQLLAPDARQRFLTGHVPVTGVLSSVAVLAAVLAGRPAVIMSNEWSASFGNTAGVNHQWSKSLAFERSFREVLAESLTGFTYFSALRPYSELWVARQFSALERYHLAFRSCNKAFTIDPAQRREQWCGECDKCCFIDLILAPFVDRTRLEQIFDGHEPLARADLEPRFRSLLGDPAYAKPFECVGDEGECRTAVVAAAGRADRIGTDLLQRLARDLQDAPDLATMLAPLGQHFIPPDHAALLG
jgi:hypothetical protein